MHWNFFSGLQKSNYGVFSSPTRDWWWVLQDTQVQTDTDAVFYVQHHLNNIRVHSSTSSSVNKIF